MSNNPKNEIRVENVSFKYLKENVIENAHFHIERGSFTSFVGPNGGGKSTLAKLILGLLEPTKGFITIFGKSPNKSRGKIGYVPQYSNLDLDFPINVMDVILMGRLQPGKLFYNKKDRLAAIQALVKVDLKGFENRHFSELSGGQRQRILIARAIVSDPLVLILDEPTSNIDEKTESRLYELLFELNTTMTIILISHDLTFVADNIKRVICINKEVNIHPTGKLETQTLKEILGRPVNIVRHETNVEETHE